MLVQFIGAALVAACILRLLYRLSIWHPLHHIPGPWWTAISSCWLQYHTLRGTQARATHELHRKYGRILRVAPNEVEIADGEALWAIYIRNGGFDKSHHYAMLDIDGHSTVFSTLQNRKRADRLKIALPFFSSASVQRQVPMLESFARKLVQRLESDKKSEQPIDLLDRCRCYSLDTTSAYVFGEPFGALEQTQLSIAAVVDNFVEVNLLFNVPARLYRLVNFCYNTFVVKGQVKQSDAETDEWIRDVVGRNVKGETAHETYPARLAASGMPMNKVVAEGKDAIFGATDALGLSLSLILWRLVSNGDIHEALREELENCIDVPGEKLQGLPILMSIIKESLRISSTVPCKLPRVTPPQGMLFKDNFIPGGVVVGVAPYVLHFNEDIYPDSGTFNYKRWLDASQDMNRDWMPFGKGARACMGRHLAMVQLCIAVSAIVRSGVLRGATTVTPAIEFWEWYNVKVVGGKIGIKWSEARA